MLLARTKNEKEGDQKMKIGFTELLVIFVVALLVVGPDKLPYYAKMLGEALGQFKKYTNEAAKEIRENVVEPLEEAQRPLKEAMEPFTEAEKEINNTFKDLKKSVSDIGKVKPEKKAEETTPETSTAEETVVEEPASEIPASEEVKDVETAPASEQA